MNTDELKENCVFRGRVTGSEERKIFSALNRQGRQYAVLSARAKRIIPKLALTPYQFHVLIGFCPMSGADLKGKAAKYGHSYLRSRISAIRKADAAGLTVADVRIRHNRRVLIIK